MKWFKGADYSLKSRKQKAKEDAETLRELKANTEFEKGDFLALTIAAIVAFMPIVLGLLFVYYVITRFIFG